MIGSPSEERYNFHYLECRVLQGDKHCVSALLLGMHVEISCSDLLSLPPSITPYKSVLKAKNFRLRPLHVPWLHHSEVHHW